MIMTIAQAALHLGVTQRQIVELITTGKLEAKKIGSQWLIESRSVDAYLRELAKKKKAAQ